MEDLNNFFTFKAIRNGNIVWTKEVPSQMFSWLIHDWAPSTTNYDVEIVTDKGITLTLKQFIEQNPEVQQVYEYHDDTLDQSVSNILSEEE